MICPIHTGSYRAHSRLESGIPLLLQVASCYFILSNLLPGRPPALGGPSPERTPARGGPRPPGSGSPVCRAVHGLEGECVCGVTGGVVPLGTRGLQGKHVLLIMLPVP